MGEVIRLFEPDPSPDGPARDASGSTGSGTGSSGADEGHHATTPAAWLLREAADGVPLTASYTLARSVVRDAVVRWPEWWDDTFGPPHREADVVPLAEVRASLLRMRLVRRRGRELLTTKRGREAADSPDLLLATALHDLPDGEPFYGVALAGVLEALGDAEDEAPGTGVEIGRLLDAVAEHATSSRWSGTGGVPLTGMIVASPVHTVLARCRAFGIVDWPRSRVADNRRRPDVRLTELGRRIRLQVAAHGVARLTLQPADGATTGVQALTFHAKLENAPRVSATIALRSDHDFVDLHRAIQAAFHWLDDHLYTFWLDGRHWGAPETGLRIPGGEDVFDDHDDEREADAVRLGEAGLVAGSTVAYVFDYGDDWRVTLTVKAIDPAGDRTAWGVVERTGKAPPQYPEWPED